MTIADDTKIWWWFRQGRKSLPPIIFPRLSNMTSISFPNLLELSFIVVFAFPKASNRGFTYKRGRVFLLLLKLMSLQTLRPGRKIICSQPMSSLFKRYFCSSNASTSTICSASLLGSSDFDIRANCANVIFVLSVFPSFDMKQ